jgi:hypothetical protein
LKNNVKDEVPPCQCFPSDQCKSPVRWTKWGKRNNNFWLSAKISLPSHL